MTQKFNSTTVIGVCTGGALTAFALTKRYGPSPAVPTVALYVAAAVICLLPVVFALVRHKTCERS
jgi:hypothetical protein